MRRPVGLPEAPGRFSRALIAAALLSLGGASGPEAATAQQTAGSLTGTVVDAETGRPVSAATILLRGSTLTGLTDEQGVFRLEQLLPGRYTVQVIVYGYEIVERPDVEIVAGRLTRIEFSVTKTIIEVPGLIVTASRRSERPGEAPVSVAVLTSREIFERNVTTLDEALPFAQGVVFNAGQMDIRGSTGLARGVGSRVLMLLDGHRMLAGVSGAIDFGSLPVLDVDRIEIVKGPHSTLFGTNALGGVVNVLTGRPPDEPETLARLHYGQYDTPSRFRFTDETLSMQGVKLQHSRWLGNVGATLFAGWESSDGFRQNGNFERWGLRAKTVFGRHSDRPVEAFLIYSREDEDEFFDWLSEDRPLEVEPIELGDWKRDDDLILGLTASPINTQSLLLQVKPHLYYTKIQNHFHDSDDFHKSTRYATDIQLSTDPVARHGLTFGSEVAATTVTSTLVGDPLLWDLAAYGQDEVEISDKLRGSLGLRLDYHAAEGAESELNLSPKFGLVYKPTEGLSLRTSVSRGYRAPTPSEQFTETVQFGFRVIPNLELRGESAWAGEVGLTANPFPWLWLDGAVFHSEYDDLIEPSTVPDELFLFQFRNVADARVTGLDVGAKFGIIPDLLGLDVSYMFLDSKNKDTGKALQYRSKHNVTGTLWGLKRALAVDVRFRSRVEEVLAFPFDPRDDITVVDVRGGYRLLGVDLQAKITNLFQAEYVDVQERNPGASRSFVLSVSPRL